MQTTDGAADPGITAFRHDGGNIGVLLIHGFTSAPESLRGWADHLAAEGHSVRVPLLPGHATSWQEMNRTTFDDWLAAVTAELQDLTASCRAVVVGGLSMGGTLTLRLAELYPAALAGIILVNPSVLTLRKDAKYLMPLVRHWLPAFPPIAGDIAKPGVVELGYNRLPIKAAYSLSLAWPVVRRDLPKVTVPVLLLHSRVDHTVEPVNSQIVRDEISSTDVTDIVLERSYHVATHGLRRRVDLQFFGRVHRQGHGGPAMTVSPGEDDGAAHQEDDRGVDAGATPEETQPIGGGSGSLVSSTSGSGPAPGSGPTEPTGSWRADPSDDDVDAAFAAIVSGFAAEARWSNLADAGPEAGAQRHPSAGGRTGETGGRTTETGEERARRRELRRLERAEEVAAFAAEQAQIEAERAADEAHFEPPEPPPLPKPKGRTVGAILLLAAGIALLARPGLLAVSADLALVLAVLFIIGGVTLLLTGIWQRRHSQDADGDDGAVV